MKVILLAPGHRRYERKIPFLGLEQYSAKLWRLLDRRSGLIHFKVLDQKDLHFCFPPRDFFLSVYVVAGVLAVKEVKFPLIVLTLIKVVEAEGKIPAPENAGNIGDSRLSCGGRWSQEGGAGRGGCPHPGVGVGYSQGNSLGREWQISFIPSDDIEKLAASCVEKDSGAKSRQRRVP